MKSVYITGLALAFSGMIYGQSQRLVLSEAFSNASCAPCASQNPGYNTLLGNNTTKVVKVKYQTNWPGTDPMNAQNPTDVSTRVSYYAVNGVPWGCLDGTAFTGSSYSGALANLTQTTIDNRYSVASPFDLQVSHSLSTGLDSAYITVDLTASQALDIGNETMKLHVLLVEKEINFTAAPGSNGETSFESVMRKMYPDGNGTTIASAWTNTQNQSWNFDVAIPSYVYDMTEVAILVFVQNNNTKEVYQAGISQPLPVGNYGKVNSVNSGLSGIDCQGDLNNATATIENVGNNAMTSADVYYQVDNGTPASFPWTGNLASGATANVNIPAITGVSGGNHTLNVWLSNINNSGSTAAVGTSSTNFSISGAPTVAAQPEDFEGNNFPTNYIIDNLGAPIGWGWVNGAGATNSTRSIRCRFWNMSSGTIAYLYTKRFDLSSVTNAELVFDVAYTYYTASSPEQDRLEVHYSTDCGSTWNSVFNKAGTALSTAPPLGSSSQSFVPTATQWRNERADIPTIGGISDVLLRFKGTSDFGDMLYVDNIFLGEKAPSSFETIYGMEQGLQIFPNPAADQATLRVSADAPFEARLEVVNMLGAVVYSQASQTFAGVQDVQIPVQGLANGMYQVRLVAGDMQVGTRLMVQH